MSETLDREQVSAFLKELAQLCARHGIQAEHGRDTIMLKKLNREESVGYGASFGFSAGWRLELVPRELLEEGGVMPREFEAFD